MTHQELLRELTESYLKALIADVSESLGADFDTFAPFGELGINSFYVLKIIKKLEADFGTLPKSLLFENFNINDLAGYFVGRHASTLETMFAKELQGTGRSPSAASVAPEVRAAPAPVAPSPPVVPAAAPVVGVTAAPLAPTTAPLRIAEADAYADPVLGERLRSLFADHRIEGCVSRGTRRIAPNLFIGSERRGFFNYSRNRDLLLVYGYTGPRDYLPTLVGELQRDCAARGLQLHLLCDEPLPPVDGVEYTATPFGVLQRIVDLQHFSLEGGAMRRLRYQVAKFAKAGDAQTVEYRCGSDPETDRAIADLIDRWCAPRTMVNPLIHDVRADILSGTLGPGHRLFITRLDGVLQNAILITEMSGALNGHLMDLEFYPPEMPLGGLEFAIVNMIGILAAEGCGMLSLGGTYGCKLEDSSHADPQLDRILEELREQNIFNDAGNLQFKNKFRPENHTIYLCRAAGTAGAEHVIDIIMMIADPVKAQVAETFDAVVPSIAPVATAFAPVDDDARVAIAGEPRSRLLAEAGFNPLNLAHPDVEFDLKTDSWAQLETASIEVQLRQLHAQLQQPAHLEEALRSVFPFAHCLITDSGKSAENAFFRAWPKKGVVLQNLLFPSTIFHQIDKGFTLREIPCAAALHPGSDDPWKGELSIELLRAELARDPDAIAMVCIEIADNAVGGAPVSVRHLREVRALLADRAIPLVLDVTRIVENARLVVEQEPEFAGRSVWTVVREILSCADAVIGSLTKDFCVKKGGIVATGDARLFRSLQEVQQAEGGALDAIDQKLIALSLQNRNRIESRVLRRIDEVRQLGRALQAQGVPVASPIGGHCVLVDVKRIPEFRDLAHPVASFLAWMYLEGGVRAGAHSVGMQQRTAINDMVRLAIPVGLRQGEVDELIDRLVRMFEHKRNLPDLVPEPGAQTTGNLQLRYRLKGYRHLAGTLTTLSREPDAVAAVPVAAAPAALPSDVTATVMPAAASGPASGAVSAPAASAPIEVVRRPQRSQDVAIVGMAGRYPGAQNQPEFWDNLSRGRDCIGDLPADRLERRLRHEDALKYRGGFIDGIDRFDSLFFNISPREAEMLDPQERLFLEVAWEAIEDAGYYPELLAQEDASRNIGVFVGAVWAMYQMFGVEERHAGNKLTPNSFLWSVANRVSYWMNFSGPSLTLDTACSSSLTAAYLACEAIINGECAGAIVGGVNLDLHQAKYDINFNGGALSSDGFCRSFGKGANGYVAGEGVGALFLRPLERAIADGDHIYGVIKSAVVNHGGRTSGYTVPNPKAQSNLISAALDKAGIDARTIGYIEAHGTGTELGDPIEITGLDNVFKAHGVANGSCAIGSVKSNIGHLEAAAGVVGIAKVLLQMKHRRLVPSLHSAELNEFIDFADSSFRVQQTLEEWVPKVVDGVRYPLRAGISSFGAGGSNAHLIIEHHEAPARTVEAGSREHIFPLSARTEDQLREVAARLRAHLERESPELVDVAHTLRVGRKSFDHRLAIVAGSRDELVARLAAFIEGRKAEDVALGHAKGGDGVTRLLNRREKEAFVAMLSQRRDPRKVAELWAEGLLSDWQGYAGEAEGRRIPLPTYPFADRRHWVGGGKGQVRNNALRTVGVHPMVDANESTFERQIFRKTFHERDFFIYDHLVADIPTLPGVAYLEFARKAGELAAGRKVQKIRNILWISPIAVQNGGTRDVYIELKPSGESVQFEVFSFDDKGGRVPHSQGRLVYATRQEMEAAPEYIDVAAIRDRVERVIDGPTAYPLFKSLGLNLGPSFQVLQEVYRNDEETFGVLRLPEFRRDDLADMPLHPSLVDGSLQAGMGGQLGQKTGEMFVPFSIGEVEILHPLETDCYSYVTEVKDGRKEGSQVLKTNVFITDASGRILVKIRESTGVPLRDVHKKPAVETDAEGFSRLFYEYAWNVAPLAIDADGDAPLPGQVVFFDRDPALRDLYAQRCAEAGVASDPVLIMPGTKFERLDERTYRVAPGDREHCALLFASLLAGGRAIEGVCFAWPLAHGVPGDAQTLQDDLATGVHAFLAVCQGLIEHKLDAVAQTIFLHAAKPDETVPQDEAVGGFIKALQLEHPKFLAKTVEVRQATRDDARLADALTAELRARVQDATAVRWQDGVRSVRKLRIFDGPMPVEGAVGLREGGTYLITGGAGGLGLLFADHLAREYRAKLVLTGRSPPTPELEAKLDALREAGAEVLYVAADIATRAGADALIADSRARFGAIHGVLHAAGVIRDSFVRNKTADEMTAVLAPKVFGSLHLDEASRDEPLDFFVAFSSLAGVAGNAGQCDYSYANHFMDSFAALREARRAEGLRSGRSLSINWSLWADGGMKLDEQTEIYFKKTLGIKPLGTIAGLDAFAKGIASDLHQFAALEGIQEKVELAWGLRRKAPPAAKAAAPAPTAQTAAPSSTPAAAPAAGGDVAARLQEGLSAIVMDFLKLDAADVATDKILLDLGFDSIGLTTFANAINDQYGLDITPVLFFDYPSIGEISKHLAVERGDELAAYFGGGAPAAPAAAAPVASASAVVVAESTAVEFRKGWNPAALDRETASPSAAVGFDARHRFIHRPIAIVGMSGVMPMSDDLDAFWDNLKNSTDMISVVPADRWRWEDYFGDPLKEVNKSNSKWGGFMNEVDKFDPFFFGISPREAQMMDPQQRIFLETVWKAVEDAGQKVSDLSGTRTGVFVGVATNDYIDVMSGHDIPLDGYSASGNSHSVLANRISFLLNLRGPSAPIDTACSSSLVALHRAVESLHTESCDMAIVGGVHVMLSPAAYISFSMAGMLSPDGRCKTFDKRANGYVRGEGSGAVFLKHLSAAEADGNHIYAVIKATAENHGGKVTTLTAPNSAAQAELLVEAYDKAGVDPATVGYIECHGTGTSLGDPIEIQALTKAFAELYKKRGKPAPQTPHCGLSSVKTNIGHLETAAGIAGLLKVLLSIKHRHIPANLHFEEVNPYINLKGTPFFIADRLTPWAATTADDGRALPRIAGVSSFGFGGANAHIVLEEYLAPARAPATATSDPQLIVLSAKNDERLRDYARRMRAYLQTHDAPLVDFARTLQIGRDEMAERLALVVSNTDELVAKFGTFAETGLAPAGGFLGNVRSEESKARLIDEAALRALHERRDLPALAEQWASGARIDWRALYDGATPRRLSLPTYPFARDRYWMPIGEGQGGGKRRDGKDAARAIVATEVLHPLVQRNVSTLEAQAFATAFTGDEFYFEDHQVRTRGGAQKILPGVAYIEMARMAGELSANAKVRVVRNLTWERPVVIGDGDNAVEIVLAPVKKEVKFTVRSAGAEPRVTHCSGRLAYAAESRVPERLDIAAIRERCREQVVSGEELYAFLDEAGLQLGPSFRIVQSIHATAAESLSVLRLPEHLRDGADAFCLHPALMDGSLHTAIGLMKQNGMEIPMSVPYTVGEVRILHPLDDLHYGYATWAVENPKAHRGALKVDFHLLDRNGRVLVRMKDFVSMPYQAAAERAATSVMAKPAATAGETIAPGLQTLVPVWNPLRVDASSSAAQAVPTLLGGDDAQLAWLRADHPQAQRLPLPADAAIDVDAIGASLAATTVEHLVWIAPDVAVSADTVDDAEAFDPAALVAAQTAGTIALYRSVKALLQAGYANRRLQWTLIVSRTQQVTARDRVHPAHAGVIGLVGSLAKEYPQWDLRLLDVDALASVSARECFGVPADKQGDPLARRGGEWFRQTLALAGDLPAAAPACRDEGVYVVIGGAGGVGEVWSREMIVRHRANIVWIGRRERDAAIDAKIDALAQLGPAPMYLSADATDPEALAAAARTVLETFPAIHGVVHSAIVLQDQSLARMDEATFRASLAAKVDVCAAMGRAFGALPLDFMLFFSSVVSFVKSAGQANYAAGCTFKDSFALHLDQTRDYAAKTINWGYWGSVGIVADESYNRMMEMMGIGSIEPEEGMACLRGLLDSDTQQLVLIKTRTAEATAGLGLAETVRALPATLPAILPQIEGPLLEAIAAESIADLEAQLPTDEMNDLVTELLASGLIAAGVFADGLHRVSELAHAGKAPAAYYERWLDSSLDQLRRQGFLDDGLSLVREVRAPDALWSLWTEKRAVWGGNPNLNAQLTLMEVCLRALPDILTGRRPATDVMFPNSSMELVEGIYRGNAMADYFNEVLGRTLVAAIECLLRSDPAARIRILEIGAGTGGTTARLLPMLEGLPIEEYCYTDVSRAFLMYAEKQYKPKLPALTTALFDVTRPLAGQPIEPGRYDFAIATNVLHATPNIRETLRNGKAALKREGVLLMNEISEWALFSHLTFGLLEGWWLHEDTGVRIPGSPGLSQAGWSAVLADEGYARSLFPTAHARRLGQQVIAAASDGRVRQRIVRAVAPAPGLPPPSPPANPQTQQHKQTQARPAAASAPVAAHAVEATNAVAARSKRTMKGSSRSAIVTEQMQSDFVQKIVVETLSQSLQMDAGMIRGDYPFADYGVDSIVGVNLVRTISETLQIELETTSLFEYSTVHQLAKYILSRWSNEVRVAMGHGGAAAAESDDATDVGMDADADDDVAAMPTVAIASGRFATDGIVADADEDADDADFLAAGRIEPIAIIGMSGRFAESETLEAFWENLRDGRHLVKPVTRWAAADCIFSDTGQDYCSAGSFIDAIDRFDPEFFGISAVEAAYMDPQHRLFLEESWKALEDAGYGGSGVHEKQCGVYVGCGSSNYESLFAGNPPPQAFWGNSEAVIPARIAYHLNLQGPAIAIDTACSSSLVAIHLACQGLWSRETEMALAGGVFLQATPGFYHVANRAGMLSPDGVCRSFDADANGFVPGEGVGAVVLKRLRDAVRDGDHVHGVVIGTGINQDGSSNGLIAPNARAQERLERSIYDRFGIDPSTLQVLEAHGTGTLLGDSIEYAAINRAFREYTDRKQFCAIGTVKTNIGHAATAAGIAGVIKLLLAMRHRQIPPSLHYRHGNPAVDFESGPFYVNTALKDWSVEPGLARRAAISGFGFSGTNAHLILEEAPVLPRVADDAQGHLFALSARTADQLRAQVRNLLDHAERTPALPINDLCFSLLVGRTTFAHRLACTVTDRDDLIRKLSQWLSAGAASEVHVGEVQETRFREQASLKKFGNYCIRTCVDAPDAEDYLENLSAVADLFVQGYALAYDTLFARGSRRLPLPTYPFADGRYWVESVASPSAPARTAIDARVHPLLHVNTSTLAEQRYETVFDGSEPFLRDHAVEGHAAEGHDGGSVLPPTILLEMIRVALEKALPNAREAQGLALHEIAWAEPLRIDRPVRLTTALFAADDARIDCEIVAAGEDAERVYLQARAVQVAVAAPARLSLDTLRGGMRRVRLEAGDIDAALSRAGVQVGPICRAITDIHQGDRQLLARLAAPADAGDAHLRLACLMTGALQACARLAGDPDAASRMPSTLAGLRFFAPCGEDMYAWVRHARDGGDDAAELRFDVDLVDADGRVCVQAHGLVFAAGASLAPVQDRVEWTFVPASAEAGDVVPVPMPADEKIALFMKQEAALLLGRRIDEVPMTISYFDLGFSSLAIANLIRKTNALIDEELSPSALFEYKDIRSLSTHLAATYPAKIDALRAIRSAPQAGIQAGPHAGPHRVLTPFPRRPRFDAPRAEASSAEASLADAVVAEVPVPAVVDTAADDKVIDRILWRDVAADESYDKVTF